MYKNERTKEIMMNKEELLNKAKKYNGEKIVGVFIAQERKLHDSGYRLMNIIGHSEYDKGIEDFHYYLLSTCSDVVDFNGFFSNKKINELHIDINEKGIIHIWGGFKDCFKCNFINVSNCMLETIKENE
jgi:hypothetical protein